MFQDLISLAPWRIPFWLVSLTPGAAILHQGTLPSSWPNARCNADLQKVLRHLHHQIPDVICCLLISTVFGHILRAWASGKAPRKSQASLPFFSKFGVSTPTFRHRVDAATRSDVWRWHVAAVAKAQDVGATKEKPSPARFTFTLVKASRFTNQL